MAGLEPTTFGFASRRAIQLHHIPKLEAESSGLEPQTQSPICLANSAHRLTGLLSACWAIAHGSGDRSKRFIRTSGSGWSRTSNAEAPARKHDPQTITYAYREPTQENSECRIQNREKKRAGSADGSRTRKYTSESRVALPICLRHQVAQRLGFEPRSSVLETEVLPLHHLCILLGSLVAAVGVEPT